MGKVKTMGNKGLLKEMKKYLPFYMFLLPALILVVLFCYMPMEGLAIAFKDYKMARGIEASDWVGFKHFQALFSDPNFYRVLGNTLKISILTLLTTFPVTIVFTLLVNEISSKRFKSTVQTITYMPHFLSWVVVGTFVYQLLSPTGGVVNAVLIKLGILEKPLYFMAQKDMFVPIYLITNLWKSTGYSIVIYLATIAGIDTTMYDAARLAKDADVSELWLTHYSPSLSWPEDYMDEVRRIFPRAVAARDGQTAELRFEDED